MVYIEMRSSGGDVSIILADETKFEQQIYTTLSTSLLVLLITSSLVRPQDNLGPNAHKVE